MAIPDFNIQPMPPIDISTGLRFLQQQQENTLRDVNEFLGTKARFQQIANERRALDIREQEAAFKREAFEEGNRQFNRQMTLEERKEDRISSQSAANKANPFNTYVTGSYTQKQNGRPFEAYQHGLIAALQQEASTDQVKNLIEVFELTPVQMGSLRDSLVQTPGNPEAAQAAGILGKALTARDTLEVNAVVGIVDQQTEADLPNPMANVSIEGSLDQKTEEFFVAHDNLLAKNLEEITQSKEALGNVMVFSGDANLEAELEEAEADAAMYEQSLLNRQALLGKMAEAQGGTVVQGLNFDDSFTKSFMKDMLFKLPAMDSPEDQIKTASTVFGNARYSVNADIAKFTNIFESSIASLPYEKQTEHVGQLLDRVRDNPEAYVSIKKTLEDYLPISHRDQDQDIKIDYEYKFSLYEALDFAGTKPEVTIIGENDKQASRFVFNLGIDFENAVIDKIKAMPEGANRKNIFKYLAMRWDQKGEGGEIVSRDYLPHMDLLGNKDRTLEQIVADRKEEKAKVSRNFEDWLDNQEKLEGVDFKTLNYGNVLFGRSPDNPKAFTVQVMNQDGVYLQIGDFDPTQEYR